MDSGSRHIFRDEISFMALSVILSVYGADPIAEVKIFSILHFTIRCMFIFKHLLFHLDWQKILVKNRQNFPRIKLLHIFSNTAKYFFLFNAN
jgi:hypothetical protein